jgi:phenylalanyl-tRNA synthetase beta chain
VHGFEHIGGEGRIRGAALVERDQRAETLQSLRVYLAHLGYQEIVTSSFMKRQAVEQLGLPLDDVRAELLAIDNPCHGGETLLRTTLTPSLLDAARHNVNAGSELPVRLFQINKAFLPNGRKRENPRHADEAQLPEETLSLQAIVVGRTDSYNGLPGGLMEIRGLLESTSDRFRLSLELDPGSDEPFIQKGLGWKIRDGSGRVVGQAGLVASRTLRAVDLDTEAALFELDLHALDLAPAPVRYEPFTRFPAVKRDLSLVAGSHCSYGEIHALVRETGGPLLEHCRLFDHFQGKSLQGGTALGIRLQFRSRKGNLKGKAVDQAIATITAALEKRLGVTLRA